LKEGGKKGSGLFLLSPYGEVDLGLVADSAERLQFDCFSVTIVDMK
jgi:hypothetical protein